MDRRSFGHTMYAQEVEDFVKLARRYCQWVEDLPNPQHDDLTALKLLLELYSHALALPQYPATSEEVPSQSHEQWKAVCSRFDSLSFRYYNEVFDPFREGEEIVVGDICDDLADIYGELKGGIVLWDRGLSSAAVWHWKLSFQIHWSAHASGAIRALDRYLQQTTDLP